MHEASSIENFALCEFMASHGYVVISSPSRGTTNRFLEGATDKDLETQARDIEFLLKESMRLPYADQAKIALMGFSFGGLSQVLTQMRNDRIDAIISLDGSVKYQLYKLQKSPFYDINQVDIPFIHFSQKEIPEVVLKEDNIDPSLNHQFAFFDSLKYSDAYHYQFHHLTHAYFSTLGVLFQTRDPRQDKSDVEIMSSYKWVCHYTLNFLDAYLRDDESALAFLNRDPSENTQQVGLISKTTKSAKTRGFTFQDFNDLARDQDYQKLEQLYDSIRKQHLAFEIPEGNLNNLGLQLVFHPSKSDLGIRVFHFATTLYPNSANLWDSLAEGYLYLGKKQQAIESFEKSLQLDPRNSNAENRLQELEER